MLIAVNGADSLWNRWTSERIQERTSMDVPPLARTYTAMATHRSTRRDGTINVRLKTDKNCQFSLLHGTELKGKPMSVNPITHW